MYHYNRMSDPIVKVKPPKEKKKTPGRKKTVIEPMRIIISQTPIVLSFD